MVLYRYPPPPRPFEEFPFRHVHINNFFTDRHLSEILATVEVAIPLVNSDDQLFAALFDQSYKIIEFPGCIVDRNIYIKWHRTKSTKEHFTNTSCEGFGVTLRLSAPRSPINTDLTDFMNSKDFQYTLAGKFGLDTPRLDRNETITVPITSNSKK